MGSATKRDKSQVPSVSAQCLYKTMLVGFQQAHPCRPPEIRLRVDAPWQLQNIAESFCHCRSWDSTMMPCPAFCRAAEFPGTNTSTPPRVGKVAISFQAGGTDCEKGACDCTKTNSSLLSKTVPAGLRCWLLIGLRSRQKRNHTNHGKLPPSYLNNCFMYQNGWLNVMWLTWFLASRVLWVINKCSMNMGPQDFQHPPTENNKLLISRMKDFQVKDNYIHYHPLITTAHTYNSSRNYRTHFNIMDFNHYCAYTSTKHTSDTYTLIGYIKHVTEWNAPQQEL